MKGFNIMTLISSTRFFNGALLAGAMALISTEVAVAQPAPGTADSSGRLVQTWDKTFPRSEKVDHQKVTFKSRYGITLAADVYLPKDRGNKKLAALVISGPFGAVKEQASGLYAQTLAERGFVTLAFDPSYTGESSGEPRNIASPDINTEDFMAAVDFMGLQPYVDRERIGVIGICGMGGIALNAVAVDKRVKAVVASTMYDMSRVMSKGYNDSVTFVRAYSGIRSKWYQAALSQQAGKILAIGQEFDVLFAKPSDPELESKIDQAYLKKYSGSSYVSAMTGIRARAATIEILPS
ncbi:TPA: DUF2255 family protein [Klebsiella pneumoniae]|uniref:DUF2255 family protein n=1 Tax=Klebsiella pneumoniae TaxID=573 RepID=UPI001EB45FE2|nr:DUF2255 family protein [Klebsiella pneumoniae]MBY5151431.1 DUF2255 family protein [Klebsiella pneumoniae]MBZ7541811.1 DUF2255 family protein [Klebsiella pneumoniae]